MQTVLDFDTPIPPSDEQPACGKISSPDELKAVLLEEFKWLNAEYFEDKLTTPNLTVSTRKAFGGYYRPKDHKIVVSWQAYVDHGFQETLNTFRHEVAHIVHPNHSRQFWDVAIKIGATQRYASRPKNQPKTPHKYTYACPTCGRVFYRNKRIMRSSCGVCDKKFNPKHQLKLVPKPKS